MSIYEFIVLKLPNRPSAVVYQMLEIIIVINMK